MRDLNEQIERGLDGYGVRNAVRRCPKCGKDLVVDSAHSGLWGTFYQCPEHGIISTQDIVRNAENARDPGDPCGNCDHLRGAHDEDGKCSKCGCKGYKP